MQTATAKAPVAHGRIKTARITDLPKKFTDPVPKIWIKLEGVDVEQFLFDYFPDEITFTPEEFLGLTPEEARTLKFMKDKAYLAS